MDSDILSQVKHHLDVNDVGNAVEQINGFIPSIITLNRIVYEEMLKQGFNEKQAFKFSCEFTLKAIYQGQ